MTDKFIWVRFFEIFILGSMVWSIIWDADLPTWVKFPALTIPIGKSKSVIAYEINTVCERFSLRLKQVYKKIHPIHKIDVDMDRPR